jgi:glyoxylase-like metal-dependent hydrolase (beta-lactamase superfamily II)
MVKDVKISNKIVLIEGTRHPFSANSYIFFGNKGTVLIDPGHYSRAKIFEKYDIDLIILTHYHYDHSECAISLSFPIGMHLSDARYFSNVALKFKDSDMIFGLKVIHTPGHTPGSSCLFYPAEQTLFSGDTIFANGFGRTDLVGGDPLEMQKSLSKLKNLDFQVLLPGHGRILKENAREILQRY